MKSRREVLYDNKPSAPASGWSSGMVNMALTDQDKYGAFSEKPAEPDYPSNLQFALTKTELDKLGLDTDCAVGALLEFECRAKVRAVSEDRVELQIIEMMVEHEETEA